MSYATNYVTRKEVNEYRHKGFAYREEFTRVMGSICPWRSPEIEWGEYLVRGRNIASNNPCLYLLHTGLEIKKSFSRIQTQANFFVV